MSDNPSNSDDQAESSLYNQFISDITTTDWIVEKMVKSDSYTQNLYAAICNNELMRNDVYDILVNNRISFSWRAIAGILSEASNRTSYMEFYCSGINVLEEDIEGDHPCYGFVSESVVTDEIRQDLKKLGWIVMPYEDEL